MNDESFTKVSDIFYINTRTPTKQLVDVSAKLFEQATILTRIFSTDYFKNLSENDKSILENMIIDIGNSAIAILNHVTAYQIDLGEFK
jgi:hypothetical protein